MIDCWGTDSHGLRDCSIVFNQLISMICRPNLEDSLPKIRTAYLRVSNSSASNTTSSA